jgi:DNA primase
MLERLSIRTLCEQVRSQTSLAQVASRSVRLKRVGSEWRGCCPFHPDRTPSFTIYADDRRFMCFGCGAEGDVLDFIMRRDGVSLAAALELAGVASQPCAQSLPDPAEVAPDRTAKAAAIWASASPAKGTPAETYLSARGIRCSLPDSIRFAELQLGRSRLPTLIAAVSTLGGEVLGIQRTFLSRDGSSKATLASGKSKLSLGRVKGGAIRLTAAGPELIVTEGLEDGLTLLQDLGRPVWVAAGASMLPLMELPRLARVVTIGADNDPTGDEAARAAARAFAGQGRHVRVMKPDLDFKDFNAQLLARQRG